MCTGCAPRSSGCRAAGSTPPCCRCSPLSPRSCRAAGCAPGSAYSIASSASLLSALLAAPSQAGSWCGVVGVPQFGAEAAERLGVDLSRLVLIPEPGPRWLAVTATIAEVLPVVAVRPGGTSL